MPVTIAKQTFQSPTLRRGAKLAKKPEAYFSQSLGGPAGWADAAPEDQFQHIVDMGRGRCPFLGQPRAGEHLEIVPVRGGGLEFDEGEMAPWSVVAVMSSPSKERDIAAQMQAGTIHLGHFDPLDDKAGFEALDVEMHAIPHESLDFYQRPNRDREQAAKDWYHAVMGAWRSAVSGLAQMALYMESAEDHVKALRAESPKDWMNQVGIYLPALKQLQTLADSPLWKAWEEALISPFLLQKVLKAAGDDAVKLLPDLRVRCALRTDPESPDRSDIAAFLEDLAENYPAEAKPQHVVFVEGAVVREIDTTEQPVPSDDGPNGVAVKGRILWSGRIPDRPLL